MLIDMSFRIWTSTLCSCTEFLENTFYAYSYLFQEEFNIT